MYRRAALFSVSIILLFGKALGKPTQPKYLHPGAIVDAYSNKGIPATAYAYGSQNPNKGAGCPTYPGVLDTQKSVPGTGNFTFHIDSGTSGYLGVYCEPGYAARTETANDNSVDRTRVQPDPITLFPTSPTAGIPSQIAAVAIGSDLKRLGADFAYYMRSNPTAFAEAEQSFSAKDRSIVRDFMRYGSTSPELERRPDGWEQLGPVDSPAVAFAAITRDLNNARSDLIYYAQADEGAYFNALSESFPGEAETIEAIRKRPQPFGRPN
jgi:hypothetical protein